MMEHMSQIMKKMTILMHNESKGADQVMCILKL